MEGLSENSEHFLATLLGLFAALEVLQDEKRQKEKKQEQRIYTEIYSL